MAAPVDIGPTEAHTKARLNRLIFLVERIDQIEIRLEEIEAEANRHWWQLTLTFPERHAGVKIKRTEHRYICPNCHGLVELTPLHGYKRWVHKSDIPRKSKKETKELKELSSTKSEVLK